MHAAGKVLRGRQEDYAKLMTAEMGKPITQGRAEAEKCAWVCDYYADNAETFLASQAVETDASKSFVAFEPIGVVLAVMPWNFPFWQVLRFAAPALMAGNAGLLKHSSNVMGVCSSDRRRFSKGRFSREPLPSARHRRTQGGRRDRELQGDGGNAHGQHTGR